MTAPSAIAREHRRFTLRIRAILGSLWLTWPIGTAVLLAIELSLPWYMPAIAVAGFAAAFAALPILLTIASEEILSEQTRRMERILVELDHPGSGEPGCLSTPNANESGHLSLP